MEIPIGKGIAGRAAKEGRALFVEDIHRLPEEIKAVGIAAKSAIAVPLKKDERIIGTLGLYDKLNEKGEAIPFSLDDLAVAEGIASISAVAIDKVRMQELEKKAEAEILDAKKRMELLFDSVQGGIVTLDRSFNIIAANRYAERWIDLSHRDIIHRNAFEVFHEKGGICPHCAAKATFEDGSINTITQSSGLNYADLASYPVKDESGNVVEAVVFIQDITERVLYREEIMGLYREVMQTKEYMEGLINNSADAIVTTDIDGIVKSWNPAAETIYGFKKEEAIGKYLPFVPDSLRDFEKENIEKIKAGEVLKLETFRQRKGGNIIEVSLALSPIKDVTGEIIGISGISRDITDKKRVEKELIRRNQELSRLFFISSAMRGTLELDMLLRMVLTAVTMSDGLGFNRAILFLVDEDKNTLKGMMGVGPANPEEAWKIWEKLSLEKRTLHEIMREIEKGPQAMDSFLDRLSIGIEVHIEEDSILTRTAKEKRAFTVQDVREEPLADIALIQQLGTEAFSTVPLISRDRVIGVMWVDNKFNRKPITEEDMKFLVGFSDQVASAIEAARLFHKVSLAEAELENIFRSISDMVFITGKDYTLKNVNQAVLDRLGIPRESVVGHKCYKVFHGMDEPWHKCPHHKTVETMKAYVEELEDVHLGGTFITSTAPMFDTDGGFQGTVHVVRDISEIRDLTVKLQSAERMAALGEVAAKVAHEIRNPLVSVGGFAKRLEEKLDGSLKEYALIILEEVKRLESILKDILGFVKEVRMSRMPVDLNDIVTGVLGLMSTEFQSKGNSVVKDLSGTSVMMVVDPDRLKEAILNIVSNANQSTDGGNIGIKTYTDNGKGVVEVSDDGYGIRKEDLERIFDPFFTTKPTGTGLGLAISKRIVEENNGTIRVESIGPGQGTKFTIYIPLQEE
jgi:PAS domain S-box-containing protein